tara:strand:- start:1972 stop:3888 length:1917 start_codon:yes stop_codon:yes gene_type:complete
MKSIFNVSNEEAKRIRNLHEVEGENKKIDSTILNEAPMNLCGGPYPGSGGPVGGAVHWTGNCPGSPNLLNPFPCARINGQTPSGSHIGWQINIGGGDMNFCATVSSVGPFNGNSTSYTPTPLERANSCTDCDTPYDPSGGVTTYDCNGCQCSPVAGSGGQYASMAACQGSCCPVDPDTWDCENGNCYVNSNGNGQYSTLNACQQACEPDPVTTYDCTSVGSGGIYNGQCVPVNGPGGQYQTIGICQQNCKYEGNWRCKKVGIEPQASIQPISGDEPRALKEQISSQWNCIKDPNGPHASQAACQANCPPRDEKIDCINCEAGQMTQVTPPDTCPQGFDPVTSLTHGDCTECQNGINCVAMGWGFGPGYFNSMALCQANCSQGGNAHDCVNGACVPNPTGQYATLAICQSNCSQGGNTWDCTGSSPFGPPSACVSVNGPNGAFATEEDCLASPCACDDVISIWPLYTGNPNSPTGNWYGTPHDGPSNLNAIQNQLNNLQGNPNFPGGNPVQQHKMKCKEAAMQFWLSGPGNIACCADPAFAAGAATADPLGCVSTASFIPMMNNFMNNHAGWPNQGCNWLQGVLASAQTQLATGSNGGPYPPTSNAFCKITGKINFITNFIATAQSSYLTGTAVFTPGC